MTGPKIVCAGCGSETTLAKPVCDGCLGLVDRIPEPVCNLCDEALVLDKSGLFHVTHTGGYAGKCLAAGYIGQRGDVSESEQ